MDTSQERERMISAALEAFDQGEYPSIRAAAKAFNLDHSNLSRRKRGQQSRVDSHSKQQKLSQLQEDMLAKWLREAELAGQPFNHAQIQEFAAILSRASGGDGQLGNNWTARFLKRHPEVRTKRQIDLSIARASAATKHRESLVSESQATASR